MKLAAIAIVLVFLTGCASTARVMAGMGQNYMEGVRASNASTQQPIHCYSYGSAEYGIHTSCH